MLRFESYRRGIVSASSLTALAQLVNFIVTALFAYFFGAGQQTDVYLYAISTLSLIVSFITSLNGTVLIPESMRLAAQESRERSMAFLNLFFYAYLAVALPLSICMAARPVTAFTLISRFDPAVLQSQSALLLWAVPLLCMELVSVFLADILASYRYFTVPALTLVSNRVVGLSFLLAFHERWGVFSLLLGSIVAYGLQIACLLVMLRRGLHWRFGTSLSCVRGASLRNVAYSIVGNFTSSTVQFVPLYLLSGLGAGTVTAFNFAMRILNIPQNLIMTQTSAILGIRFNEAHARGALKELSNVFCASSRSLFLILALCATMIALSARPLVMLAFEHGAFGANDAALCALFLQILALRLPFFALNTVAARIFMASQKIPQAFWYQCAQSAIHIGMILAGIRMLGVIGFPLASLAFTMWNAVALLFLLRALFPYIAYGGVLRYAAQIGGTCATAALVTYPVVLLLRAAPSWISAGVVSVVYLAVMMLLNAWWHVDPEAHNLIRAGWLRLRPRAEATR